jgi:Methyltransferase domain
LQVKPRALLAGVASFLPVLRNRVCGGTGGTSSARYCYSVWLRHLVKAKERGLDPLVDTLAELGPGDSLGIGLSALLSGVHTYLALDAKPHAALERNISVLETLLSLFENRAAIPDEDEFPAVEPKLPSYEFPRSILTDEVLGRSLTDRRLSAIRGALQGKDNHPEGVCIRYCAPWWKSPDLSPNTVDMVISQAVMEHVEDVFGTYRSLFRLVRPGGFMSHNIDFRSHGLTWDWNGHWTVSNEVWRLVRGTRPYLINRAPHSVHLNGLNNVGFRVVGDLRRQGPAISRNALSPAFRSLSDDDLIISGALFLAVKPTGPVERTS